MTKTLIVVMGTNRYELSIELSTLLNSDSYHIITTINPDIMAILWAYDADPDYHDIIFIMSDIDTSNWYINTKYDEKVLLKGVSNIKLLRGPSITWTDISELPSLILRLERNVSEHANF